VFATVPIYNGVELNPGTPGTTVDQFCNSINALLKRSQLPQSLEIPYVLAKLSSKTGTWWDLRKKLGNAANTWDELSRFMKQEFKGTLSYIQHVSRFHWLNQMSNSILEFSKEFTWNTTLIPNY
jgi:hypothetical protein